MINLKEKYQKSWSFLLQIVNNLKGFYQKEKKYIWIILNLLIILIPSLLINIYIIPDLKTPSDNLHKVVDNNITYLDLNNVIISGSDFGSFDINQNDLNSGNLNTILWKLIYLNGGKDKICFEKTNFSDDENFYASFNGGEYVNIIGKKCYDIPKNMNEITFNVKYSFNITIPEIKNHGAVNKSDCIPETINETEHTCITWKAVQEAKTEIFYFNGDVYLEPNNFHRIVKFLFIFFSTGAVLWAFSRTIQVILYGWFKK